MMTGWNELNSMKPRVGIVIDDAIIEIVNEYQSILGEADNTIERNGFRDRREDDTRVPEI